jgi:hypothetical protein
MGVQVAEISLKLYELAEVLCWNQSTYGLLGEGLDFTTTLQDERVVILYRIRI